MGFLSFGHSRNIMEHLENLCQTLKKWIERIDFNVEHSFKGTWWPLDCLDDFARCWSILMVQGFVGCQPSSWFTKLLYDNVCSFRHVYVQGLSIMIFWLFYSYPWDSKKPPVEGSCVDLPPWKITAQWWQPMAILPKSCRDSHGSAWLRRLWKFANQSVPISRNFCWMFAV